MRSRPKGAERGGLEARTQGQLWGASAMAASASSGQVVGEGIVVCLRADHAASTTRFTTPERLYGCEALLKGLTPALRDVESKLRQLIQQQPTVVHQQHLPRQGRRAAPDHAHSGDGIVRGAERAGGDDGGAPTGRPAAPGISPVGSGRCRGPHEHWRPPRAHDGARSPCAATQLGPHVCARDVPDPMVATCFPGSASSGDRPVCAWSGARDMGEGPLSVRALPGPR
jgi:hypothetical protein